MENGTRTTLSAASGQAATTMVSARPASGPLASVAGTRTTSQSLSALMAFTVADKVVAAQTGESVTVTARPWTRSMGAR